MIAMAKKISGIIITVLCIFTATAACAAADMDKGGEVSHFNLWMAQDKATDGWYGMRDKLEKSGLGISSNYIMDVNGNPTGGIEQKASFSGLLYMEANLDFEKISPYLQDLALKVSNFLFSGQNLSYKIGNFYWVQEVYVDGNYFLGVVDLSLSILDDTFVFETGRISAGDIFGVPTFAQYYVTSAVNGRLAAIPSNVFFPHYNIAAWGARATYQPNKEWDFVTGIYNADPSVSNTGYHGANFNFDMDKGYLAVGQLTYKHGQSKSEAGLPGSATFGAYYESSKFTDLGGSSKIWRGNYGFYLIADQMIYRGEWPELERPSDLRSDAIFAEKVKKPYHQPAAVPLDRPKGLSVWGGAVLAPEKHINTQTYQVATGLIYQGLPPNRNRDVTAFLFVLGHFSEELAGQSDEMIIEFNHRFQLGPWFYITPDIQYIINPNGQSNIDDALVLGFEANFDF
jgi:porin